MIKKVNITMRDAYKVIRVMKSLSIAMLCEILVQDLWSTRDREKKDKNNRKDYSRSYEIKYIFVTMKKEMEFKIQKRVKLYKYRIEEKRRFLAKDKG